MSLEFHCGYDLYWEAIFGLLGSLVGTLSVTLLGFLRLGFLDEFSYQFLYTSNATTS